MKAVVAAFNQEKALVGAFSVITNLRMELFEALLQAEFPAMTTFSTLSPIPGFRSWLIMELTAAARGEASPLTEAELATLRPLLGESGDTVEALLATLKTSSWTQQPRLVSVLRPVLTRLCARYLYTEKRRNFALNSVANFHLRNGSCLWRINWMADTSRRGLANSFGLMVNYRLVPQID